MDYKMKIRKDATYLVAFSGGKDSVAMVLHLLACGIEPSNIVLHHHDVDGGNTNLWDWPCTPSYCRAFAKAFGLKILFNYRQGDITREIQRTEEGLQNVFYQREDGGIFHELESRQSNTTRGKFPAVAADLRTRWCSAVVKIDVLSRVIANHPDYQEGQFFVCTGERRQESPGRAKYEHLEKYRASSKKRNAWQLRPIIEWTETQVWEIFQEFKIVAHPAYHLGWSRCSCQTCIFSSTDTWASLYELAPEKVEELARMEKEYNHTIYNGTDILSRAKAGKSFLVAENVLRWKKEAMSEFISNIISKEVWDFPQGAFSKERGGSV